MCGIVGYVGARHALPILVNGLKRVEYRGYDSAGVVVVTSDELRRERAVGKISELQEKLKDADLPGMSGIGHTRWATHGGVEEKNSHPFLSENIDFAVVHNGIIENHTELRDALSGRGHTFSSDTDSEVLVHLIEEAYDGDLAAAVRAALKQVRGTYGLAVVTTHEVGKVVVARRGSPLLVGVGDGEFFVASDAQSLLPYTKRVAYLDDGEMAILDADANLFETRTVDDKKTKKVIEELADAKEDEDLGDYPHYMLKEIFDQPRVLQDALRGRLHKEEGVAHLGGLHMDAEDLRRVKRIVLVACGTARHAAMLGEYLIERYARIPVEVDYGSEFRYRNPVLDDDTLTFFLSQSGETADTLNALREAQRKGVKALGIVNTIGSTIARESDGGVYIHAGSEKAVAATKSFMNQVAIMAVLALTFGRVRGMSLEDGRAFIEGLEALPEQMRQAFALAPNIREVVQTIAQHTESVAFLGRGPHYPIALEGALKLEELAYIHSTGLPAGEIKHGPLALVDEDFLSIVLAPKDRQYEKTLSTIEEIRARKGCVLAVGTEGDTELAKKADVVFLVPKTSEIFQPMLSVIPLQLFAYEMSLARGCSVDKPRNLAKSVTVE